MRRFEGLSGALKVKKCFISYQNKSCLCVCCSRVKLEMCVIAAPSPQAPNVLKRSCWSSTLLTPAAPWGSCSRYTHCAHVALQSMHFDLNSKYILHVYTMHVYIYTDTSGDIIAMCSSDLSFADISCKNMQNTKLYPTRLMCVHNQGEQSKVCNITALSRGVYLWHVSTGFSWLRDKMNYRKSFSVKKLWTANTGTATCLIMF